ncbi:Alpha crystallin/Hsp20 domain [Dillenia turbinata]|uniref:Alpha crystallin/Hsp20 domain n=1 Tax=Dillenia turbinata TaxID=194707 RepID=A0AAN8WF36_9MAGN
MASSLALRTAVTSSLFSKLATSRMAAPVLTRAFNTNVPLRDDGDVDDRVLDVDRRSDHAFSSRRSDPFFSDVFDPFSPTRSLSQVLNLMDSFMENPILSSPIAGSRRGWDVKEDENALSLKIDMPGLGKENVKVSVEQDTLIIKGEGERESEEEASVRKYSSRIQIPPNLYKLDSIKAEMKNGVLKVVVPKVKEEERKDVFQVNIE